MTVYCADISNWQGDVTMSTWPGVGIHGCIAKALEGMTGVDRKWARNRGLLAQMAGPGFVPGAYHYVNNIHPAADQCKAFLELVPGDWMHGFDVEAPGPIDVDGWFREYRRHYPHKVVALYTNLGMWKNRSLVRVFDVDKEYGPVEVWVAGAYPGAYQPGTDDFRKIWSRVPAGADGGLPFLGFDTYALMQYTGSATVPGVPGVGNCDMSVAGSIDVLKRLAATNGGTDDMSQADVDAINAHTDQVLRQTLAGYADDYANAAKSTILGASLGSSGPTVGVALQSGYQMAQKILAQTDTLEASAAAESAADAALQAGVDTLNAKLGSGEGGTLTKADLLEALGAVRLTTDPQQPTA